MLILKINIVNIYTPTGIRTLRTENYFEKEKEQFKFINVNYIFKEKCFVGIIIFYNQQ